MTMLVSLKVRILFGGFRALRGGSFQRKPSYCNLRTYKINKQTNQIRKHHVLYRKFCTFNHVVIFLSPVFLLFFTPVVQKLFFSTSCELYSKNLDKFFQALVKICVRQNLFQVDFFLSKILRRFHFQWSHIQENSLIPANLTSQ